MLRGLYSLAIIVILAAAPAFAQKPAVKTTPTPPTPTLTAAVEKNSLKPQSVTTTTTSLTPGELKATPEMWFYEQYKQQYMDPKMAVRANAEFRADQRQRRIASMQWFGFSNSRPQASGDPFNGGYSPHWSSNNPTSPYSWAGVAPTYYMAQPVTPVIMTR